MLLASTVMCGGLAVGILVPFLSQTESPSGKSTSQPAATTPDLLQPSEIYAEFYPAVQSLTSHSPTHEAHSSGKKLPAGQEAVAAGKQFGRLTGRQNANPVKGSARPVEQWPAPAPIPSRLPASRNQTTVVSHDPGPERASAFGPGTLALTAGNSTSERPGAQSYSEFAAQNRHQYSRGATTFDTPNSGRSGEAGSVYAPITVHPVTVNVDSAIMADHLAIMTERLEKLLESRDSARRQIEVAEAVSKKRRASRTERPNVQPADNSAQLQQLAQLNQNLQDISKSFERFQTETQRTVNEISIEGRRAELAYEEIRSVQRQLESQIERARLRETQQAAVIHSPVTRTVTGPAGSVPGVVVSAAPWPDGGVDAPAARPLAMPAPTSNSLTTRPKETPKTQTVPPPTGFNIPPAPVPAPPFSAVEDELIERIDELSAAPRKPAHLPGKVVMQKSVTATPKDSAPEPQLVSPNATGGEHLPRATIREQNGGVPFPTTGEIPPQTKVDSTSDVRDKEFGLLLAYKARRLMQEAQEAMETGETAIACSRALQAKSLASSGFAQNRHREDSLTQTDHRNGTSTVPAAATDELRDQDPVEAVRTARLPANPEVVPLVNYSEHAERKVVKPVAFEHVYRFELADVEPATGTSKEPSLIGVPCKQCGRIHAAGTASHHRIVGDSEPDLQTQKSKLFTPKGARRSNRRTLEDSDDSTEADAIWDAAAIQWAREDKIPDEPSTLHRLSSAIRRLGRPATE